MCCAQALQQKGSDMKRHFNRLCPGLLTVLGGGSSTVARDPVADIDIKGLAADVDQPDNVSINLYTQTNKNRI